MLREQERKKKYLTSRPHRYYENHPEMQDKAVMLYHKVIYISRSRCVGACNAYVKAFVPETAILNVLFLL